MGNVLIPVIQSEMHQRGLMEIEGYRAGQICAKASIYVNDRLDMVDIQMFIIKSFQLFFSFENFHNKMLGKKRNMSSSLKNMENIRKRKIPYRHQADTQDHIKMFCKLFLPLKSILGVFSQLFKYSSKCNGIPLHKCSIIFSALLRYN